MAQYVRPRLPDVPEPAVLKQGATEQRKKYSTWDSDSGWVWYGNSLASYIWTECGWKTVLREDGVKWQGFLRCLAVWRRPIISWLRGQLPWEDLMSEVRQAAPLFSSWLNNPQGFGAGYFNLRGP